MESSFVCCVNEKCSSTACRTFDAFKTRQCEGTHLSAISSAGSWRMATSCSAGACVSMRKSKPYQSPSHHILHHEILDVRLATNYSAGRGHVLFINSGNMNLKKHSSKQSSESNWHVCIEKPSRRHCSKSAMHLFLQARNKSLALEQLTTKTTRMTSRT